MAHKRLNRIKNNAFTLVELLVVISIIALMLAVLMPALQKAREQGRKVVCGMNIKQINMAFLMYGSVYNDMIVHDRGLRPSGSTYTYDPAKLAQAQRPWDSSLAEMWTTKNSDTMKKYLMCPADRKPRTQDTRYVNWQSLSVPVYKRSYNPNWALYNFFYGTPNPYRELEGDGSMIPTKIKNISQPAAVILVGETHIGKGEWGAVYGSVQGGTEGTGFQHPRVHTAKVNNRWMCTAAQTTMHQTGGNYGFTDGHVEWHGFNVGADYNRGQPYKGLLYPNNWIWDKNKSKYQPPYN